MCAGYFCVVDPTLSPKIIFFTDQPTCSCWGGVDFWMFGRSDLRAGDHERVLLHFRMLQGNKVSV